MNIAVVDVAAEKSGALTVMNDFVEYISSNYELYGNHFWYVYSSVPINCKCEYITNILVPEAKKGRIRRLIWDKITAIKEFEKKKIDVVISLQNAGFKKGKYKQLVYFHNSLLLDNNSKYSLLKKKERNLAIYTRFISKYTLNSLKNVDYVATQTNTVRKLILNKNGSLNTVVVRPNIKMNKEFKNSAVFPIKNIVYPTSPLEYKKIEEIIQCILNNKEWFLNNHIMLYLTINGNENSYAQEILKMSQGLEDIVKFTGKIKREVLLDLYKNSALLISSCRESFPMPFLEAAYIGSPIIAANYEYAVDCLNDFHNVFLYKPGDIDQLLSCIKKAFQLRKVEDNGISEEKNTWEEFLRLVL